MHAQNLETIRTLTSNFARAALPTYGLASALGGLLLIGAFALEFLAPAELGVRLLRFAGALLLWLLLIPLARLVYLRDGEVRASISPEEARRARNFLLGATAGLLGGFAVLLLRAQGSAIELPTNTEWRLGASAICLVLGGLGVVFTRQYNLLLFLFVGLALAFNGIHGPAQSFEVFGPAQRYWVLVAALVIVVLGVREHRRFLAWRRQLLGLRGGTS